MAEVSAYWVRVPWRADELLVGDLLALVNQDGVEECWRISHLEVDAQSALVKARPHNKEWPTRLEVLRHAWVTVLVDPRRFSTPRPCARRVSARAVHRRGWYARVDGWDVGCGCGWTAAGVVHGVREVAETAWRTHKAAVLTELLALDGRGWPGAFVMKVPGPYAREMQRLRVVPREGGGRRG